MDDGPVSLSKLSKQLDAPKERVMQAVGWLDRENKIRIDENKRGKTICINQEET